MQSSKHVTPEDMKDCLKNAAVHSSHTCVMSYKSVSLELLSAAICYSEEIESLEEEEPRWRRTHGPLTNSHKKGVSARLLQTSDLL